MAEIKTKTRAKRTVSKTAAAKTDTVNIIPAVLKGTVKAPPSKSYAHRGVISAFLSGGECDVKNIHLSEDLKATLGCIKVLGSAFEYDEKKKTVHFVGTRSALSEKVILDCGESGSTLRFFIPIAMCFCQNLEFCGKGRLMERPLAPYFEIFDRLGIDYKMKDGRLTVKGGLKSGSFSVDGSISSQFITGLLFALPLLDGDSEIVIRGGLSSKAYIDITLDVLKRFGIKIENNDYKSFIIKGSQKYKNCNYTVEGDFSQAAFFLAAGALGCDVTVSGLKADSLQGDKKILEIIALTGAKIQQTGTSKFGATPTTDMHGITVDADEIPDIVPILAVMLSFVRGESRIINAGRLRIKESDRLSAICSELKKLGADIEEGDDFLIIRGKQVLNGAEVTSHNDHRTTMAMAIAACRCEGNVVIDGARNSVTKSYPNFFEDYKKLGGKVK